MPSSCSYSLGEVRILKKRNFIADSTMTDRDSSTTVLITRSMLTSLNDSTAVSENEKKKKRNANDILTISTGIFTLFSLNFHFSFAVFIGRFRTHLK